MSAAENSIFVICFPSCCFFSLLGIRFPHLIGQYSEAPLQGWRFFLGETLLCCLDDARCGGRTHRLSLRHSPLRPVDCGAWFCPLPALVPCLCPCICPCSCSCSCSCLLLRLLLLLPLFLPLFVLPGSPPCPLPVCAPAPAPLPLYVPLLLLLLLLLLVPDPASAPAPVPALIFPCRSGRYRHGADCIWSPCCCLPYVLDRAQCLACGLNLCNLFLHL